MVSKCCFDLHRLLASHFPAWINREETVPNILINFSIHLTELVSLARNKKSSANDFRLIANLRNINPLSEASFLFMTSKTCRQIIQMYYCR